MLIGEKLRLSFFGYLAEAAVPVFLGLVITWAFIAWQNRGRWTLASGGHPCLPERWRSPSSAVGNLIGEDDQRRKLERVVEIARRGWR